MRLSRRIATVAFLLLALLLFTHHFNVIRASWSEYRSVTHLDAIHHNQTLGAKPSSNDILVKVLPGASSTVAGPSTTSSSLHHEEPSPTDASGSKVIVMAKLSSENTDWVAEGLPEYTHHPKPHHQSSYQLSY